jgi:hypothetical protein
MNEFLCSPVSNGNPREQALIRRWWREKRAGEGTLVWEYCLEGLYADAILFLGPLATKGEQPGQKTASRFPLAGQEIVLCEAKISLTPELIGQALVYRWYAEQAGAVVNDVVVFAESDQQNRRPAAEALRLHVVIGA